MQNSKYEELYKLLNIDQKEVVDSIEGPVLVVAGPGTGKTQTLSLRVANILKTQDINPENILCLTFSESGVEQIKRRLNLVIGSSEANNVYVSTYHGFGNDLLNHNLINTNLFNDLNAINDLGATHIIKTILDKLPYSSSLKKNNFIKDIKSTISEAKKAYLTYQDIQEIAEANISYTLEATKITLKLSDKLRLVSKKSVDDFRFLLKELKDIKDNNKDESFKTIVINELKDALDFFDNEASTKLITKWKSKYLAKNELDQQIFNSLDQNKKLIDLSEIFRLYQEELEKQKLYDFDDMILNSIKLLKENPNIKYSLQERFQYILVDEFQDTNASQNNLLKLLIDNPVNEKRPNILVVGDDDQAIFAFQGAKYSHMLEFYNDYNDVKVITLKTNYRSTDEIIEISKKIANKIESRLDHDLNQIDKNFKSSSTKNGQIQKLHFKTELEQNSWLSNELKKNTKNDSAVISTKHRDLEKIANLLEEQGLAIDYEKRENILENQYFMELVYLAKTIIAIKQKDHHSINYLMPIVLNFEFLNLPTELIWQMSWQSKDNHTPWSDVSLNLEQTNDFFKFLIKVSSKIDLLPYDQIIDYLIGLETIELDNNKFYKSNFLNHLSKAENKYLEIELFANLKSLRNHLDEYYPVPKSFISIQDLIDFIDELKENDQKLTNTISYKEISNIKVMTAFSSKGLEFDNVYILSANDKFWGEKFRQDNNKISLPPNLSYIRNFDQPNKDQRLRVLYVALSRAKYNLNILSYDYDSSNKMMTPLSYMEETISDNEALSPLIKDPVIKRPEQSIKTSTLRDSWKAEYRPFQPNIAINSYLQKRIEKYKLSPTALNDFLDIDDKGPQIFFYRHLLGYPSSKSIPLIYGNLIHESLEWLINNFKDTNQLAPIKDLIDHYKIRLASQKITETEKENLKLKGSIALENYINKYKDKFSKDDQTELSFFKEDIKIDNCLISGKIDRISKSKDKLIIIDYKTSEKSYHKWTSIDHLYDYRRQLYFYLLLIKNSKQFSAYQDIEARIDFINQDPHKTISLDLNIEASEEERIKILITKVWQHINNLNFPDTSKYPKTLKGITSFENDLINDKI